MIIVVSSEVKPDVSLQGTLALSLIPRCWKKIGEECLVSTVHTCAALQVFTTPQIQYGRSATWTSITVVSKFARKNTSGHVALFVQQICVVHHGKKGVALKDEKLM